MKLIDYSLQHVADQQGVALLAGLVMLAAISLLALVATASMILQLRMAGNFNDAQQANQAAAIAVLLGEAFVLGLEHDSRTPDCNTGCFIDPLNTVIRQPGDLPAFPEYEDSSWWRAWAAEAGIDPITGIPGGDTWGLASEPPRFLIEEIHFDSATGALPGPDQPPLAGVGYYRILGRGTGQGPAAIAVSEAIVARPWLSDLSVEPGDREDNGFCEPFEPWYDCGRVAWRQRR